MRGLAIKLDKKVGQANFSRRQAQPRRIAMITPYPKCDPGRISGPASYARALVPLLVKAGVSVEVWGERLSSDSMHFEEVDGVPVVRAWRKGIMAGFDLWRCVTVRHPAVIHVQVEYFLFGGWLGFASILAFLVASRVAGKRIVVTLHQVMGIRELTRGMLREFGVQLPVGMARALLMLSAALLSKVAHVVIVHDTLFRNRLAAEYGIDSGRVYVVPHGSPWNSVRSSSPACSKRILCFGYLKWYKGVDTALRAFRKVAGEFPDWRLIIAGGLPSDLSDDHPHRRFAATLRELAEPLGSQVEFTGYVEDAAVPGLFEHADIVLFPYRLLFAASGPLSLAIGFRKPFVISEELRPLLPDWSLCCHTSPAAWAGVLRGLMSDEGTRAQVAKEVEAIALSTAWPRVASLTMDLYQRMRPSNARSFEFGDSTTEIDHSEVPVSLPAQFANLHRAETALAVRPPWREPR